MDALAASELEHLSHGFVVTDDGVTLLYSLNHTIKGFSLKSGIYYTYFENVPFTVGVSTVGRDMYWSHAGNGTQSIMKAMECMDEKCKALEMIIANGAYISAKKMEILRGEINLIQSFNSQV